MNSSVPLSPPLITAADTRIPTTTATIAQNSVVLKACLVSVAKRRTAPLARSAMGVPPCLGVSGYRLCAALASPPNPATKRYAVRGREIPPSKRLKLKGSATLEEQHERDDRQGEQDRVDDRSAGNRDDQQDYGDDQKH